MSFFTETKTINGVTFRQTQPDYGKLINRLREECPTTKFEKVNQPVIQVNNETIEMRVRRLQKQYHLFEDVELEGPVSELAPHFAEFDQVYIYQMILEDYVDSEIADQPSWKIRYAAMKVE